jgi:hypothetical protein
MADMPLIASMPIGDQDLRGLRPGNGRPCTGVPPRPAAEDRVRVRVDRLWCQEAPRIQSAKCAQSTAHTVAYQVV